MRFWPKLISEKPSLLGFAAIKAASLHIITVDDREKTPNFGKPLFNSSTLLAIPPVYIYGLRAYQTTNQGLAASGEVYAQELPRELSRVTEVRPPPVEEALKRIEGKLDHRAYLAALACVLPHEAGLSQKDPFLFEIRVGGGDIRSQFEYLKSVLGKEQRLPEPFRLGGYVDVIAVSKGKGFEGPVTRHGVKRKQHKSRKSVRAVGVLNPWHPSSIMYTVPRAGQMGFHQRVEYNKKILMAGDARERPVTPSGGFPHFGVVRGPYLIVRGSVPGPVKRLVKLRLAARPPKAKLQPPRILEMSITPLAR